MQNAADAGGLAGAKLLATNVTSIPGGIGFRVHKEDVYCTALAVVQANHSFQPGNETQVIAVAGSVPTRFLFFLEDRIALTASRERLKIERRFWKITFNQARLFICGK